MECRLGDSIDQVDSHARRLATRWFAWVIGSSSPVAINRACLPHGSSSLVWTCASVFVTGFPDSIEGVFAVGHDCRRHPIGISHASAYWVGIAMYSVLQYSLRPQKVAAVCAQQCSSGPLILIF